MPERLETRQRLRAVGCGAVLLFAGLLVFIAAGAGAWRGEVGFALTPSVAGLAIVFVSLLFFGKAIRPRDEDDDDLLHGPRATALVASLVAIAAVIGVMALLVFNVGFWRGLTGQ